MTNPTGRSINLTIDDPTKAGEARRVATALARKVGFDDTRLGKVAIVASEAATNLSKHAHDGELILQIFESESIGGIDILAIDKGPGMSDVRRCLVDGYSTVGSLGTGLGAMHRLSCQFDIYSQLDTGTVTLSRLWSGPRTALSLERRFEFGVVNVPMPGEDVSGDSWAIGGDQESEFILVVDGLGHGPDAAEAAHEVVRVFNDRAWSSPTEIIEVAHDALRKTRGAALAIALVDKEQATVRFAGIGNISGVILAPTDGRALSMISHNGIVGHQIEKIQEFTYPWSPGSTLVMSSDGLGTHWQLDRHVGLLASHPGLVAGVIARDHKRGRDDVTVVVARERDVDTR